MKLQASFFILLAATSRVFGMPSEGEVHNLERRNVAAAQACDDVTKLVPFFRLWNARVKNDYYTASVEEKQAAIAKGYSDEGVAGWIWPNTTQPLLQAVPLYHTFSQQLQDDFYTIGTNERDDSINKQNYTNLGIAGYVYPDGACGGQPFFRLSSQAASNHFYTMAISERNHVVATDSDRYVYDSTAAFLFRF